ATRLHPRPAPRGGPRPHLGGAVRPLVHRRGRRRAARAQRRRPGHRRHRRGSRRPRRPDEGLRRRGDHVRHELRVGQGRPAGGQPTGGAGLPLARAAAPGPGRRARRADRGDGVRRALGPPPARFAARRGGLGAVDRRRLQGRARRPGAAPGPADPGGPGAAAGDLGRLSRGAAAGGVLAGRQGPPPRPAAVRSRRGGRRRLDRAAAGSV
ncbi:MAG: Pyridoxamine 5'-phosphate oxidase, partial [uncultured Blastococcus sp.]